VSGWQPASRGNVARFDLTASKAEWWHRNCACGIPVSASDFLVALYEAHLRPRGFVRHYHGSAAVLALSWPYSATGPGTAAEAAVLAAALGSLPEWSSGPQSLRGREAAPGVSPI
jgi:hypothetical protein